MTCVIRYVFSALLLFPAAAGATTIDLGFISFDNLIPDSSTPGVNVFDIYNFTGATWSLPPDFPVISEITLLSATLTLDGSGGPMVISLGDIVPGMFNPPASDEFTDTETFTSATLTATLSGQVLDLFDGSTFTPASETVTAAILPSSGDTLQANTDFAVITASGESDIPEPATAALLSAALLALLWGRRSHVPRAVSRPPQP
jgi:hypothetical protein